MMNLRAVHRALGPVGAAGVDVGNREKIGVLQDLLVRKVGKDLSYSTSVSDCSYTDSWKRGNHLVEGGNCLGGNPFAGSSFAVAAVAGQDSPRVGS